MNLKQVILVLALVAIALSACVQWPQYGIRYPTVDIAVTSLTLSGTTRAGQYIKATARICNLQSLAAGPGGAAFTAYRPNGSAYVFYTPTWWFISGGSCFNKAAKTRTSSAGMWMFKVCVGQVEEIDSNPSNNCQYKYLRIYPAQEGEYVPPEGSEGGEEVPVE